MAESGAPIQTDTSRLEATRPSFHAGTAWLRHLATRVGRVTRDWCGMGDPKSIVTSAADPSRVLFSTTQAPAVSGLSWPATEGMRPCVVE
jgi:hypothetical protein